MDNEPAQPDAIPFEPSEDIGDFSDADWDDPQTPDSVRAAGCTVHDELKLMEAVTR